MWILVLSVVLGVSVFVNIILVIALKLAYTDRDLWAKLSKSQVKLYDILLKTYKELLEVSKDLESEVSYLRMISGFNNVSDYSNFDESDIDEDEYEPSEEE